MDYRLQDLPPPVQNAASLLKEAGEPVWLVGGAVRDLLLGRRVKDFDLVVAGDGLGLASRVATALKGAFVPLDEERRVGRIVFTYEGQALWIDIARFRGEGDESALTLEADLRLRDFTVNAIALEPFAGEVVDPTSGLTDLNEGILRMTGPNVFRDDPLRILRAVRLEATHNLAIELDTSRAMGDAVPALVNVAAERVREEWMQLLAPVGAMQRVRRLDGLGALDRLLPELIEGKGVLQSPPHSHDVYEHNLLVLDAVEQLWPWHDLKERFWTGALSRFARPMREHLQATIANDLPRWLLLKQAALLHDIGKPATRSVGKKGRVHYYRHEQVGAGMVHKIMRRMKFASRCVHYVERVVRHHLRPLQLSTNFPPSNRAVYRFFRDVEHEGPDIALLSIADQRGKEFAEDREEVVEVVERLLQAYFEERTRFVQPAPLLNGHEVMAISGLNGPVIGKILEQLREQQAQGSVSSREEAEALVRSLSVAKEEG